MAFGAEVVGFADLEAVGGVACCGVGLAPDAVVGATGVAAGPLVTDGLGAGIVAGLGCGVVVATGTVVC